ncbi:MAG: hypothetical protein ABEJ36_06265 [Candidatus Nanosalina sp.]
MLCLLSFMVFGFLGIFFAGYRSLALEALDCMLQRARTGECDADFETKMRSTIIGEAMDKSPRLAKFLNSYLEYITWLLIVLLLVSMVIAGVGIYNYIVFGNCNGPSATGGCSLDKISSFNLTAEIRESINFWVPER